MNRASSPRWFTMLFLTDMWERFGFYALQAILVLYAAAPTGHGGLGLHKAVAAALFGAYLGLTFMLALPGGWLGDRVLGHQRAVGWGAICLALGYGCLAVPLRPAAWVGLALVAGGGGLFKPNQQALINLMYSDRARREGAISAFYIGIQFSALLAPLVSGLLGERVNWHLGFAVSAAAMCGGAAQFILGRRTLGEVGARPGRPLTPAQRTTYARRATVGVAVAGTLLAAGLAAGAFTPMSAIIMIGLTVMITPGVAFVRFTRHPELAGSDRARLRAFGWLFLGSGLFWMLAGQSGSILNLFAQHSVRRELAGFTVPAGWLQSATPLFILLVAPVFAWQLPRLGARTPVPVKFGVALALVGLSFAVMAGAAALADGGNRVSPLWLLAVYLLIALGEIMIGAVGVSATAEAVPPEFLGQTLGLLWLFNALGGGLGSQVVHLVDVLPAPVYYLALGLLTVSAGLLFWLHRVRLARALAGSGDPTSAARSVSETV